jgi:hypothetical protein
MLLQRILIPLGLQHGERLNQFLPRLPRLNDSIHEPAIRRHVGIGKSFAEFLDFASPHLVAILRLLQLALLNNVHRALRAHHGDFRRRPGVIHIGANVL